MRQLVDAINAVFEAYGTDMPNSFYMQVGEWTRVVAYAERAFDCLEGATPLAAPSRWIDTGMPASRLAGARPWLIVMFSRW